MLCDNTRELDDGDDDLAVDTFFHKATQPRPEPNPPLPIEVLATVLLEAALTKANRSVLMCPNRVSIIKVPSADWIGPVAKRLQQICPEHSVEAEEERKHTARTYVTVGSDAHDWLEKGRGVIYVTKDPESGLDATARIIADQTIILPNLTPTLLRRAIRRVTGGVARGVTADMARLECSVIAGLLRPGLSAGDCVVGLQRAVERLNRHSNTNIAVPLLTELPLPSDLRAWTDQTMTDLKNVANGTMAADKLIFGVLEGPPGTGKSLIAESLARTAGWSFVPTSVGTWFTSGDGALGGVAKNIKSFVDTVLTSEPAIGFLDELDAIPSRETMDNRDRGWWTPIVTLVLTELDRLQKSNRKVLLLGATNYYQHLDPALTRPGRLQQRVPVLPLENEEDVIAVFRHYLGSDLADSDLEPLARFGHGTTPAAIEGWVKSARAAARSNNRPITTDDILAQMLPADDRSAADLRAIALHEAGHAVVAYRLGFSVEGVSIISNGAIGGVARSRALSIIPNWSQISDLVTVKLAGRAADMVLGNGAHAGAEADLAQATELLRSALARQGLGDTLVYRETRQTQAGVLDAEIDAHLKRFLQRALDIVEKDRRLVLKLSDGLMVAKVLSSREIVEVLGPRANNEQEAVDHAILSGPAVSAYAEN